MNHQDLVKAIKHTPYWVNEFYTSLFNPNEEGESDENWKSQIQGQTPLEIGRFGEREYRLYQYDAKDDMPTFLLVYRNQALVLHRRGTSINPSLNQYRENSDDRKSWEVQAPNGEEALVCYDPLQFLIDNTPFQSTGLEQVAVGIIERFDVVNDKTVTVNFENGACVQVPATTTVICLDELIHTRSQKIRFALHKNYTDLHVGDLVSLKAGEDDGYLWRGGPGEYCLVDALEEYEKAQEELEEAQKEIEAWNEVVDLIQELRIGRLKHLKEDEKPE